ncbi:MAG: lipase family protein [Shewanella sp.]|nr:lipase family protein [Shewanella sp.]
MDDSVDDTIGLGCTDCRKLKYIFDIALVDELGQPVANVPYTLVRGSMMTRTGVSDSEGKIFEKEMRPGPVELTLDADTLAEVMQEPHRTLRANRDPQSSSVKAQAEAEGRDWYYAKVGELIDTLPSIEGWRDTDEQGNSIPLPEYHFSNSEPTHWKIDYIGKHQKRQDITIEICPLRAWVLALHHGPEYSLVNAYNLALMSVLSYADADLDGHSSEQGSVNYFFGKALLDLSRPPFKVNVTYQIALVKDVPFSERYTDFGFIDTSTEEYKRVGNTQLFYAVNKEEAIIAWRGTQELTDIWVDAKAIQTDASEFTGQGKMHLGFKQAYKLMEANKPLRDARLKIINLIADKKLFLTGHSLGGALALIDSVEKSTYSPVLYTYGMPRVFDKTAVEAISDIIHYRHINADDAVPSIPKPSWTTKKLLLAGLWGSTFLPQTDDDYAHQGHIVHFVEVKAIGYDGDYAQQGWMSSGVKMQKQTVKLLLVPDAIGVDCQRAFDFMCQQYSSQELDNPAHKGANPMDHFSHKYAEYLHQRLMGKLQVWQGIASEFEQTKADFVTFANGAATQNKSALVLARADSLLLKHPMLPGSEPAEITDAYTQYLAYASTLPMLDIKREAVTLIEQKNESRDKIQMHPVNQYQVDIGHNLKAIRPPDLAFEDFEELKTLYVNQVKGISNIKEIIQ